MRFYPILKSNCKSFYLGGYLVEPPGAQESHDTEADARSTELKAWETIGRLSPFIDALTIVLTGKGSQELQQSDIPTLVDLLTRATSAMTLFWKGNKLNMTFHTDDTSAGSLGGIQLTQLCNIAGPGPFIGILQSSSSLPHLRLAVRSTMRAEEDAEAMYLDHDSLRKLSVWPRRLYARPGPKTLFMEYLTTDLMYPQSDMGLDQDERNKAIESQDPMQLLEKGIANAVAVKENAFELPYTVWTTVQYKCTVTEPEKARTMFHDMLNVLGNGRVGACP